MTARKKKGVKEIKFNTELGKFKVCLRDVEYYVENECDDDDGEYVTESRVCVEWETEYGYDPYVPVQDLIQTLQGMAHKSRLESCRHPTQCFGWYRAHVIEILKSFNPELYERKKKRGNATARKRGIRKAGTLSGVGRKAPGRSEGNRPRQRTRAVS